jgi:hypothetical protein
MGKKSKEAALDVLKKQSKKKAKARKRKKG